MRLIISQIIIIFVLIICIHFEMIGQTKIQFIQFNEEEHFEDFRNIWEEVENNIKITCDIKDEFIIQYHQWNAVEKREKLEFLSEEGITHLIEGKVIPRTNDEEIGIQITIKDDSLHELHNFGPKDFFSNDIQEVSEWSKTSAIEIYNYVKDGKIKEKLVIEKGPNVDKDAFNDIASRLKTTLKADTIIRNKYRFLIEKSFFRDKINNRILIIYSRTSEDESIINIHIISTLKVNPNFDDLRREDIKFGDMLMELEQYAQDLITELKKEED